MSARQPTATALLRAAETVPCRPWPRHVLGPEAWSGFVGALAADRTLAFVALWADAADVHALFQADTPVIVSVGVEAGLYAALSPVVPGAALFERMVADLWGHQAADAVDVRPWLDHGTWPHLRPLSARPVPNPLRAGPEPPEFIDRSGAAFRAGPLGATWAAPAAWCATLAGETVQGLEARFGWAHRGVLGLMRGMPVAGAARLAGRIDGAATVAHATAFSRAVEAALGADLPLAAEPLRRLLLSLEQAAVALHDLSAAAEALDRPLAAAAHARARAVAACQALTGHRLMMDAVRPGGVAVEPGADALAALDDALARLPGFVPRGALASVAGHRAAAAAAAIEAARTQLARIPAGPAAGPLPQAAGAVEGLAAAEGPRGPVWHWCRLDGGVVAAGFAASPGWLALPGLERSAAGRPLAAVGPSLAAAGLGVAGMDL